ncbi:unnamed protein product [Rhizoctonia solani]|uniref:Uncharacterized protein n=1 Tax=Rhizoctonia solani TaxID=456999 RepID=A0A8H3E0U6_9AGAM|nr:unnamed protein product [Rhizoctonia solani]
MSHTFRSSESLPSLHSFQSLRKRFDESHHSSIHLLAYLTQDSTKSLNSVISHGVNEVNIHGDGSLGEPPVCHEAWWSDFIELKPFKLRPLSNFGVDLTVNSVPAKTEASHASRVPTRPRHRPPPLELDPRGLRSGKENMAPSSTRLPLELSPNVIELDSSSPWCILNQFPTPPTTPLLIRGSKTSTGLQGPPRKINITPPRSAPIQKGFPKEQMRDEPELQFLRKKRQPSFGSLGKAFKNASASTPCSPPPIPPAWLQFDPMCEKEGETKSFSGLQRRDTFKSRLFSISASPKAILREIDIGDRKILPQHGTCAASPHGNRTANGTTRKSLSLRRTPKHPAPRSRSASQPAQYSMELNMPGSSEKVPRLPVDLEKHLIIPKRRTQSQSYINLYVPPWKQISSSPTQISFPVDGGITSMPATPISGKFELPNAIMHLPATGSTQSLTVELDPFGAGEPTSFFRSECGAPTNTVEVDQVTIKFYEAIGLGTRAARKRWAIRQSEVVYHIPDIVVSSSKGLEELKREVGRYPIN